MWCGPTFVAGRGALDFSNRYILGFSLALCLVCSTAVSALAVGLKERQEANRVLDMKLNILKVARLVEEKDDPTVEEVEAFFKDIEASVVDRESGATLDGLDPWIFAPLKEARNPGGGVYSSELPEISRTLAKRIALKRIPRALVVYRVNKPGKECLVLPIWGNGLWSLLEGFLAVNLDENRVVGITFFAHKETAGLGGEVDNPTWKAQWRGKTLFDGGSPAVTVVKKGAVRDSGHQVDGISGATITSLAVGNAVQLWLGDSGYGPFLDILQEESR